MQVYSHFETSLLREIRVQPQKRFSPHLTYTQRLISLRHVTFSAHNGSYQLELQILVSIFLCFACNKVSTDHHYEAFILPADSGQVFELLIGKPSTPSRQTVSASVPPIVKVECPPDKHFARVAASSKFASSLIL